MTTLVVILIFASIGVYLMTPDERARMARSCWALCQRAWAGALGRWTRYRASGRPLPIVTGSIVVLNLGVFTFMLVGGGAFDPDALVAWGGSIGPRTTNGEWWRLVTAMFVHAGPVHLLATFAGLIQIALVTERLVGRFAFAAVYVAAGTFANVVWLTVAPIDVSLGASAATFGIYGLLVATWGWSLLRGPRIPPSWQAAKRVAPSMTVFFLFAAATTRVNGTAVIAACACGLVSGFVLAAGARDHSLVVRRIVVLAGVTTVLVALAALPLRGMSDVRPEVRRLIDLEARTTGIYGAAVARFTAGAIRAGALAQVIDRTIVPELQAARVHLAALGRVPQEHQNVVVLAAEYLRLRDESWRVRSNALRQSTSGMRMLRDADRKEWQAREALRKISEIDLK